MEYSPELKKAAKKYYDYTVKAERYRTKFFIVKKEKWRVEVTRLYRLEWDVYAAKVREEQKKRQEEDDANVFTVW